MTRVIFSSEPLVTNLQVEREKLHLFLADGRELLVPLKWYPRLLHATQFERQNWRLVGDGQAMEWPDLDECIGIDCLLEGRRSSESVQSFSRWLMQRQLPDAA